MEKDPETEFFDGGGGGEVHIFAPQSLQWTFIKMITR